MKNTPIDYPFKLASIGGTFNALHTGHKRYIEIAFLTAEKVIIQLTSDKMAKRIKHYQVHSYNERLEQLSSHLDQQGWTNRYQVLQLDSKKQLENFILNSTFDVAVVEPAYFEDFVEYNKHLNHLKKNKICIIYKPRTVDRSGNEISSEMIEKKKI